MLHIVWKINIREWCAKVRKCSDFSHLCSNSSRMFYLNSSHVVHLIWSTAWPLAFEKIHIIKMICPGCHRQRWFFCDCSMVPGDCVLDSHLLCRHRVALPSSSPGTTVELLSMSPHSRNKPEGRLHNPVCPFSENLTAVSQLACPRT